MTPEEISTDAFEQFRLRFAALAAGATVALTGGHSAKQFYDACAGLAPRCLYYWSDERLVAYDSPDSNYKLAVDHLLAPAAIPAPMIHPAPVHLPPVECAAAYAARLPRRFDLIILGLGDDGHTGSLFPGRDPYQDDDLLVRAVTPAAEHPCERITFTPKLINAAVEVWFIITGENKRRALDALRARRATPREIPALVVDPERTRITIFHTLAAGTSSQ